MLQANFRTCKTLTKMQLILNRTYYPNSTTGKILHEGKQLSFSLELPWKDNQKDISCLPEGEYELAKRYSKKHSWHLILKGTYPRELCLIHEANYVRQLRGCIAPVTTLDGTETGWRSGKACEIIENLVFPALERGEKVTLKIQHEK